MRLSGVAVAGLHLPVALAGSHDKQQPLSLSEPWGSSTTPGTQGKRPNIVFILTDDQDLHMQSLDYLPLIKKHLTDKGIFFKRHYCTTAICCPSRVSLWTGKLAHNTNVTDVSPPYGGYPKFAKQGLNDAYLPVWLQEAGYDTYYTGKLFNAHTVDNYNSPFPAGWNGTEFLLDPYTYMYLNASYQRNRDPPVSYPGQHSVDVLAQKALSFLDEASQSPDRPFFLGIAPVAPHSNVAQGPAGDGFDHPLPDNPDDLESLVHFTPPIPAVRHAHLFSDVVVPRTPHFNPPPGAPWGGASWVRRLAPQTADNVAFNDHFYRQRLRTLQSVDELVDAVVHRLEQLGVLDNTYIFYTTDNGFHIGQHRLQPGKECGFEEDINVPLIVRGPGVEAGRVVGDDLVTAHVDLAPTILGLAGVDVSARRNGDGFGFDGEAIPLTGTSLKQAAAADARHEHVTVEFWGFALSEGKRFPGHEQRMVGNNTYKAVRVIGPEYNFYYSVWCNNEHEFYDLTTDPYQLHNLLNVDSASQRPATLLGVPFDKVISRLDALLLVLKSCKGRTCVRPWHALHPAGNVRTLRDALSPRFDSFYERHQKEVSFSRCEMGYLLDAEGPQFETDGLVYRDGAWWSEWV